MVMSEALDPAVVAEHLGRDLDGWTGGAEGISRTVELADFPSAIAVVAHVATVAEELDHHPDIDIRWRTVTFRLSSHDAGGRVTERDITLARRIDEVIAAATE